MNRRPTTLLDEVEAAALDEASSLPGALRKCVALGGQAGSTDLREWATRELRGYRGEDDLPDYRIIRAPLVMDVVSGNYKITGQSVTPLHLPKEVREDVKDEVSLRGGIGEIEAMLRRAETDGEARVGAIGGSSLAALMNMRADQFTHIERIYHVLSPIVIAGVVDQVRTTLVELVAEMRAGMGSDESVPSGELADQAVHIAVRGWRHRVTITQGGNDAVVTTPVEEDGAFWTFSRKLGAFVVGAFTVGGVLWQWLG